MKKFVYYSDSFPAVLFETLTEAKRQATKDFVWNKNIPTVWAKQLKMSLSILAARKEGNKWQNFNEEYFNGTET